MPMTILMPMPNAEMPMPRFPNGHSYSAQMENRVNNNYNRTVIELNLKKADIKYPEM